MKVLLITEVFPPRLGGDGIHVMELALHLHRCGVEVCVLTKACEGGAGFPFEVRRVGLKNNGLLGRLSFIICAIFERTRADVIHSHAAVGGMIGLVHKIFSRKPLVVTVHTIWGESLSSTRANGTGKLLQWIEKKVFTSGFDHYITVTREIADRLHGWGLKSISVIPNGVNTEKFRPAGNKRLRRGRMGFGDEKILLFVGRLVRQKNVGLLLDAFRIFHGKNPNSKLLIAGSGPEEAELREKARSLGLGGAALFLGAIDYERLPAYYQISDCLVLTSLWEGLPLCVLEALATGIPVVGTPVGGLPEVVKNGSGGYISGENTPTKIATLIGRAVMLNRRKAQTASKRIEKGYGWGAISGKVLRIYKIIAD